MKNIKSYILAMALPLTGVLALEGVAAAKTVTESWHVQGVHGASDEAKIKEALMQLPGVSNPSITTSLVKVTFDDQKVTESSIKDAISKAGAYKLEGRVSEPGTKAAKTHH
jgi:copper chaperone CopZ